MPGLLPNTTARCGRGVATQAGANRQGQILFGGELREINELCDFVEIRRIGLARPGKSFNINRLVGRTISVCREQNFTLGE